MWPEGEGNRYRAYFPSFFRLFFILLALGKNGMRKQGERSGTIHAYIPACHMGNGCRCVHQDTAALKARSIYLGSGEGTLQFISSSFFLLVFLFLFVLCILGIAFVSIRNHKSTIQPTPPQNKRNKYVPHGNTLHIQPHQSNPHTYHHRRGVYIY